MTATPQFDAPAGEPRRNRGKAATALIAGSVVIGMVGVSFAAVPLYDLFCRVTGYGGTTQRADTGADRVLDRWITIRFDANVARDLGWRFAPEQRSVRIRVGETSEVAYRAVNLNAGRSTGTATFNVTPEQAGGYFNKVACFCFTEQTLKPGEAVDMPVVFFVDPAIAENENLDFIDTITLSYTFYRAETQEEPVAAASAEAAPAKL
jgi:cytochrome c oxidase assembly protein subunit 11